MSMQSSGLTPLSPEVSSLMKGRTLTQTLMVGDSPSETCLVEVFLGVGEGEDITDSREPFLGVSGVELDDLESCESFLGVNEAEAVASVSFETLLGVRVVFSAIFDVFLFGVGKVLSTADTAFDACEALL
mmetsp:Transcript_87754/g.220886  ORF Transcript_87754/g.220886 Transcript_87754/m.220886 type:complete len:130 (-) Transcript_87754:651-1040(-)